MLIACYNVFNDLRLLKNSIQSIYQFVDKIVAVDGAYFAFPHNKPYSTDGTLEYLRSLKKVELIETQSEWIDQCEKRSEYFKHGSTGDFYFIIDADEEVKNPHFLQEKFHADVTWVQIKSPLYRRIYYEPRIFKHREGLHYRGRHHWILDSKRSFVCSHRTMGKNFTRDDVPLLIIHHRNDRSTERRMHKEMFRRVQTTKEVRIQEKDVMSLKIVQFMGEDRAGVGIKLGQAINQTTEHVCRTFRHLDNYIQYEKDLQIGKDRNAAGLAQKALRSADVVHLHEKYGFAQKYGSLKGKKVVMHHHGTLFRRAPKANLKIDKDIGALTVVSTFDLLRHCFGQATWLPTPIPVARYFAMRNKPNDGIFRICQSPTSPRAKGTEVLRQVCERIKKDHKISLVCIQGISHEECLKRKALCDVSFDSFDIGLQVSGLEGMAMGQPVLAGGDNFIIDKFKEYYGKTPYIWVAEDTLEQELRKLIEHKQWFDEWVQSSLLYVRKMHDYSVVAKKVISLYENLRPT